MEGGGEEMIAGVNHAHGPLHLILFWQILTVSIGKEVTGSDVHLEKGIWSSLGEQAWKLGDKVGGCSRWFGPAMLLV